MLYRAKVQGKVLMIYNPIGMTLYPINFILYSYVISWYSNIEDEDGPCISRYLSPQGIHINFISAITLNLMSQAAI